MPCVEVWQTSDLRPLRLGEEKKEEDRRKKEGKKLQGKNIMAPLLHRAAIKKLQDQKILWSALLHRATIKN